MDSPVQMYTREIKKKFKSYYATWLPSQKMKVGDIGELDGYTFQKITSLDKLGIKPIYSKETNFLSIDYASGEDVSIKYDNTIGATLDNNNSSGPSLKVGIEFGEKGSFLIKANNGTGISLDNIFDIGNIITKRYENSKWSLNWVVVTHVISFPRATIIISNSKSSKIEFNLDGEVPGDIFSGLKGEANLSVISQKGDLLKLIGENNVTPLFQLHGLKRKLIGVDKFGLASRTSMATFDTKINTPNICEFKFELLIGNKDI